jgi:hypothetical protein
MVQAHELKVEEARPSQLRFIRLSVLLFIIVWHKRSDKKTLRSDALLETADGDPSFISSWILYLLPTKGTRLTLNVIRGISFLFFSTSAAWLGVDTFWGTNSSWGYPHARSVLERRREESEAQMKGLLDKQNAASQETE